ncbi:hypothetical protein INT47_011180 [Mucor saturninus]|uniref:Protein UNC80 C-terminal domain-containing protein n=1 Tax=Mucor saturninus TaxID=64648 RepID=A0A8H7RNN2_9FUNG|nr:hypothetical protein INT47_011180 [Mucor saturninus]
MSNQDQPPPNDKPQSNETPDKNNNEKKKRTLGWDRIRETVSDNIIDGALCESPTSSSPSSTRSTSTPKPGLTAPVKKQTLNPFMRNQPMSTLDIPNGDGRPTLSDTTLVAAKAAGLSNFSKNFRTPGQKNGVIYATSTAVQQDIFRLERDLDKLLVQLNPLPPNASLSDPHPSLTENMIMPPPPPPPALERYTNNTFNSSVGKRSVFHKQPAAEMFHSTNTSSNVEINELVRDDASRISSIMSSIMELIVKHKSATRLPLTAEILALLAVPFDKLPFIESDCLQALDIFDYIRNRFTTLSKSEHFEQISFCCRLLGAGSLKTKQRTLTILDALLQPCAKTTGYVPQTPEAYHSLVYTLTNALAQFNVQKNDDKDDKDDILNGHHDLNTNEQVRSSILTILDDLVNGSLIPVMGSTWKSYHSRSTTTVPNAVARFCVVEALLKSLMMGNCNQTNPYHGVATTTNPAERSRDLIILQELLPRYWKEPGVDERPAYFKIIFLLTELACETFLMSSVEDLKVKTSVASLLIPLVVDKLSPAKLQYYLADRNTVEIQKMVAFNVIVMLLSLLSICSFQEQPLQQPGSTFSSPKLSPQPSMPDFASIATSISTTDISHDYQSISSFNIHIASDAAMRKLLLTLKSYIEEFWNSGYKDLILAGTESMHQDTSGERSARCFQNLIFHINPTMGEEIVKKTLPSLFKRLVDTYPPAIPSICQMLHEISKRYRSSFFKPVVSCVASDDEDKVSNLLNLITCLRRYMSGVQFWMQDAEMINVLLLSDVGKSKKNKEGTSSNTPSNPQLKVGDSEWGSTTLGQCAIATEFMWAIKEMREKQRDPHRNMEEDEIAKKFLIDLERRLSVFLTAKEKMALVPMPLRVILCNIFMDMRFFCNTTHRPGWLTRVIDWATQPVVSTPDHVFHHVLPIINPDESPTPNNPPSQSKMAVLHMGHLEEVTIMFERLNGVYLNVVDILQYETNDSNIFGGSMPKPAQSGTEDRYSEVPRHKRQQLIHRMYPISRSAALSLDLNPPVSADDGSGIVDAPASKLAKYRFENMEKINQDPFGSVFSLLAAVFTTLSSLEFGKLVRPLWERHVDDRKSQSFIPAVFLLMECGEKIPKVMIEVCTHDFYSGDPLRRLAVIQKHSSLSAFRFNVLGQEYIPISSRRRPFRGDGGAFSTPFVPTDLGSNQFTLDEPRWMSKLKNASNFPIELKRQIQELGWDDEDNGDEHEALKKVLTPLALLPSLFLEEEDERMNEDETAGAPRPNAISISKIIIRRKRATTIHSLTIAFLSMVDLLNDDYGGASNALRELLEYFLRDDPSLFLRAFISDLGKFKLDRHKDMLTRLRYLVSMQHKLPPGFTHILFNYLAGMLKWLMRENKRDGLVLMTIIHPILAELTLSTNDLTIRDLRKNKIEHLLVSTGRFWFTHEQPADMFPRYLSNDKTTFTILDIPPEIFSVAMLRISHIQFLTNYLVRYPREVYAVKKTLQDYEPMPIPGAKSESRWTMEDTYFPDVSRRKLHSDTKSHSHSEHIVEEASRQPSQQQQDTEILSALRARIWLRFIDNLLNGLNKNYNDREELERILQGINAIITKHDRDFGIIGQTLILYTRVVTRFKRLFISNRGYTTFLPALFKVFCEVDCFPEVRSAIIFAWCRFYAVHEESFVFQMLGTLVPSILTAYTKSLDLGSWMIDNLFTLMQAMNNPPHLGATSDVLGLQLQVELDDHERSIQERIDAASNPMAMPLSTAILKPLSRSVTVPITPLEINNYNNRSFELSNFIKLFLTIIAYDPGSLRAEQFVKIFRHMIPKFNEIPVLKDLIDEGMAALVDVFAKFSKNAKPTVTSVNTSANGYHGVSVDDIRMSGIGGAGSGARTESAQHAYGKQWQQNDRLTVKKEFVILVHEYLKHEGVLSEFAHEKMAHIIKIVMQNYSLIKGYVCPTDWIKHYLIDSLHSMAEARNASKSFRKILNLIFTQYRVQWKTMDASDLYDGLAIVLEQGQGNPVTMHEIAGVLNEKFVSFGMTTATLHNWEGDTKGHTKFCNALVRLIIAIMENSTQDVLGNIEQQPPTSGLIGNIIIPICFQYNLQWDYSNMPMSGKFRPDPTSNWTRLLNYISRACSQASLLKSKSSGFSLAQLAAGMGQSTLDDIDATEFPDIKDSKQTPQSVALLFSLSFVAMKTILVRGSTSFNKLRGSWVQIAYFIKTALVFGQTLKFLKPKSGRSTPINVTSPAMGSGSGGGGLSPGVLSPGIGAWTNSNEGRTGFSFSAPLSTGTIYDFTTWRFLEFVSCYKSPLLLFLKDFIQEKLIDMGGSHGHNRSSLYSPLASPGPGMNFGGPPSPYKETGSARWKSWGGGSPPTLHHHPSHHSNIPQVNVQDTDSLSTKPTNSSPPNGLGLHIPGQPIFNSTNPSARLPSNYSSTSIRVPPSPSSPSLSYNLASELSDTDSGVNNPSLNSPKLSSSIKQKKDLSRPSSSIYVGPQGLFNSGIREASSTVLHVLHAESITSIVQVQLCMGFKPALPWMASKSRHQLKPWHSREAIAKISGEWQLLLQLYAEFDANKVQSPNNNHSNSQIPTTPLL